LLKLEKIIGLAKELGVRFMHFNYIPTGRAKEHVELDLTPDERLHVLQTIGKEIIGCVFAGEGGRIEIWKVEFES
jgi:MoaA/NifB/PqqE/SkfB family radical SAM enzyme